MFYSYCVVLLGLMGWRILTSGLSNGEQLDKMGIKFILLNFVNKYVKYVKQHMSTNYGVNWIKFKTSFDKNS